MKERWKRIGSALAVAAVMACILFAGLRTLDRYYLFWNGSLLSRTARELDISGKPMRGDLTPFTQLTALERLDARGTQMTPEQYEWFCRELPGCTVLWDIPIQGVCYSQDAVSVTAGALTPEEAESLRYLTALREVDLRGWDDWESIRALHARYPGLTVRYDVAIGPDRWDSDSISLVAENADGEELLQKLERLPGLQSVLLTGAVPERETITRLQRKYPDIFFLWKLEALGMELETDVTELDLAGSRATAEQLREVLPYLPNLRTVELTGSAMDSRDLTALAAEYPDVHFLFDLAVGDRSLHTSAAEIDLSNIPFESTAQVEALLPAFHDLEKVVMCQCGIGSEEMDALNRKYPDIRFVWSVNLAGMPFRTDAVHFTPNRWGLKCTDENIRDLRYCTDMVCVDIGHATSVTNCEFVRFMPELKYLVLAETGISDLTPLTGHKKLVFLELFLSKVKDYSPLVTCRALEDLNLCYTQGDYTPISQMTWLKRLWWSGCWKARKSLPPYLPDTVQQYLSRSSTGEGWREGQHYYDMRDFIGMGYMTG